MLITRESHCGFSGSLPMVCCEGGNVTKSETETRISATELDLRDGKHVLFKNIILLSS